MKANRLLIALESDRWDCHDMHDYRGIRNVYVVHYVESGSGWFEVDGKKYRVEEKCMFLFGPEQPVCYYPDPDDPFVYKWIDFTGELVRTLLSATGFADRGPVTPPIPELECYFDQFNQECDPLLPCNPKLLEMFSVMIRLYPAKGNLPRQQNQALSAREYIMAQLHNPHFRVHSVAEKIGVSRTSLWRNFREQFGMSPVQFMIEERMINAKRLLKNGETVKFTAMSCGFDDQIYFSLAFKKRCGVSPEVYRAQNMKNKE